MTYLGINLSQNHHTAHEGPVKRYHGSQEDNNMGSWRTPCPDQALIPYVLADADDLTCDTKEFQNCLAIEKSLYSIIGGAGEFAKAMDEIAKSSAKTLLALFPRPRKEQKAVFSCIFESRFRDIFNLPRAGKDGDFRIVVPDGTSAFEMKVTLRENGYAMAPESFNKPNMLIHVELKNFHLGEIFYTTWIKYIRQEYVNKGRGRDAKATLRVKLLPRERIEMIPYREIHVPSWWVAKSVKAIRLAIATNDESVLDKIIAAGRIE